MVGLGELHDSPEDGAAFSEIDPVNPLSAFSVIVDVDEDPGATAAGGVALTVKSWNFRMAVVACVREPLVAVIVSV